MTNNADNALPRVYDRTLLLYGSKRNEVLSLAEIEQYGLDSFADANHLSIYGMPPREWFNHGIRLLGRTAVECTRDVLAARIGRDIATVSSSLPSKQWLVIDPFAGSCNTLFWILKHLQNSEGIAFESDSQVFEFTQRNLAILGQKIKLFNDDYARLLDECSAPKDWGIVVFIAPPWGTALDEMQGLDLRRTTPPVSEVVERIVHKFSSHAMLFATQVYEKVGAASLTQLRSNFAWSELCIYDINRNGRNHGILLGTHGCKPFLAHSSC